MWRLCSRGKKPTLPEFRPKFSTCLAVGVLKKPVEFRQMGTPDIILHPRVIFMLAISDPKEQLGQLKKIMKLLQNDDLLMGVRDAGSAEQVVELLNPALAN